MNMPNHSSPEAVTEAILKSADHFVKKHSHLPGVNTTFRYFTHHPVAKLNKKRLIKILEACEQIKPGSPLRVLDLCCGGGIITSAIAQFGHRALGFDLSHDEIQLAKLFAQEESWNGIFDQVDLIHDPLWEREAEESLGGKPDVVILAYALHHLPKVEFFMDRLSRWLNSGAVLLINEENPRSPTFQTKHWIRTWVQKDTEVENHKSYEEWKEILEKVGFVAPHSPVGIDFFDLLEDQFPQRCWSILFNAERRF